MLMILSSLKFSLAKKHQMINIILVIVMLNLTLRVAPPLLKVHPNIDVRLFTPIVAKKDILNFHSLQA